MTHEARVAIFWITFSILWFVIAGVVGGYESRGCESNDCRIGSIIQGILWPVTLPYLLGENLAE